MYDKINEMVREKDKSCKQQGDMKEIKYTKYE